MSRYAARIAGQAVRELEGDMEEAKKQLQLAWQQFEQAGPEPELIDAAIFRLNAAEKMFGVLFITRATWR